MSTSSGNVASYFWPDQITMMASVIFCTYISAILQKIALMFGFLMSKKLHLCQKIAHKLWQKIALMSKKCTYVKKIALMPKCKKITLLPMLLGYLRITYEIMKIVNISASQSFRGSSLLFLHSIIRLHILATQLHTGYGGMEREWSISTPMPQRSSQNSCLRVLFPPLLVQLGHGKLKVTSAYSGLWNEITLQVR